MTPDPKPQRLYLVDGYSIIFRAFYAIRDLSNSRGEPTNAVYGFVNMLRKLLRDESPELVGVALDVSGPTVRSERYDEYKANRTPMPEDLRPQIPWVRRAIEAFRIPILELATYEADDVLGTLAHKASEQGYPVVLVTADKDLMQLVDERISLFHTGRNKLYDPAAVEEDFGVPPEQVVDVLALMGDSVDNVPGVAGIGEKGARQLIREYGSLENLLERASEVKRKSYREGLQEHREDAVLSKELVTLHCDLPLDFDPQALRHDPPDPESLRELYRRLEFFSLLKELESDVGPPPSVPIDTAQEVTEPAAWRQATESLKGRLHVAPVGPSEPVGLAVLGSQETVLFADFRRPGMRQACLETLDAWLDDPHTELAGHDLKELLRLSAHGPTCRARLLDTMLVAYLLRSPVRTFNLEEVVLDRLQHQPISAREAGWDKSTAPLPGDPGLLRYAAERVVLPQRLALVLEADLEKEDAGGGPGVAAVYHDIEEPLVAVLVGMEETGILLDVPFLEALSQELDKDLHALEGDIYDLAGERFNINSPQQLGVILFEKLGYPVGKRTRKTKSYSTNAETLEDLASKGFDLPQRILRFRELSKLKSTYVDALPASVAGDGRLHTRYYQAVAATGRLSSANPNLQNIPVRTEVGQRIRKAFRASEGHRLLVADYSQIELRVLAHIAREEALIRAFRNDEDIHTATASSVFGVGPELVTGEQRRAAKTINFGIIYGMSAYGLAQNLGISPKEASRFITAYFERYPGVKAYSEETRRRAEEELKVETLYGRTRWLPDIRSKNRNLRENARRMAINARIQGTAADLLKLAMIAVDRELRQRFPQSKLLLTVHDELVLEVPEEELPAVAPLVKERMEGVADLAVPLVVEVGAGTTWYEAKE